MSKRLVLTVPVIVAGMLAAGFAASCCPEPQCPQPAAAGEAADETPPRPVPEAVEEFFGRAFEQVMACAQLAPQPPAVPVRCEAVAHGADASVTDVVVTSDLGSEADACIQRVLETRPFPQTFQEASAPLFFVYTLPTGDW